MRIAFVQTYPIYHDLLSTEDWLGLDDRNRWICRTLTEMGHTVELWAIDRTASTHESNGYLVRLFRSSKSGSKTKHHFSNDLVNRAESFDPELCLLKGTDGAAGVRLIERFLKPRGTPYVMIIGGKFYTKHVPRAAAILYETDFQRNQLIRPDRPWRRAVNPDRLLRFPKTIDTEHFRPMPEVEKSWDLLTVGRLVPRVKSYDVLGEFPHDIRIAVAGGGPDLAQLRARYPWIHWLGYVEPGDMPRHLNSTRLSFFSSLREYYPRVMAEASSCGIPAVALKAGIAADVLPPDRGILVDRSNMISEVRSLLDDPVRMAELSLNNRIHAESTLSKDALTTSLNAMLGIVNQVPKKA